MAQKQKDKPPPPSYSIEGGGQEPEFMDTVVCLCGLYTLGDLLNIIEDRRLKAE